MAFVALTYNLAESSLIRPEVIWVMLVIASASLAKLAKQRQGARVPRYPLSGATP